MNWLLNISELRMENCYLSNLNIIKMLKDNFGTSINIGDDQIKFRFDLIYYGGDPIYHVTFRNEFEKPEEFRMRQDENGQWKIMAQVLSDRISNAEMDLNNAIESAQESE